MSQPGQSPKPGFYFHSLEGFRAVAVILVLLQHHTLLAKNYLGAEFFGGLFSRGQFRMDIFFLLSGFFAAWRGQHKPAATSSGVEFFVRRMFRLLPLLWILTTAKLILIHMTAEGGRHDNLGWFDVVRSYTMLPAAGYPLLLPAWTLSFELVFCAFWCVLLYLPGHARCGLLVFWAILIVFDGWGGGKPAPGLPGFILHPYFIDFIGGALLGQATCGQRGWSLKSTWLIFGGCTTLAVGLAIEEQLYTASELARRLVWGGGSGLLLAGVVGWEWGGGKVVLPSFLRHTARASYSIYLSHSLVLVVVLAGLRGAFPISSFWAHPVLWGGAIAAYGGGLCVYWLVERPLMAWLPVPKFLGLKAKESRNQD